MFKPAVYEFKDGIRRSLTENGLAVIENALEPDFAERLYEELDKATGWQRQYVLENEGTDKEFRYSRNYISFKDVDAPASLQQFRDFLRSEECRNFIAYVRGLACVWVEGAAAKLEPGDSIDVHNDNTSALRTVGLNLYLNKDWQPDHGGEFVLLDPYVEIAPTLTSLACLA